MIIVVVEQRQRATNRDKVFHKRTFSMEDFSTKEMGIIIFAHISTRVEVEKEKTNRIDNVSASTSERNPIPPASPSKFLIESVFKEKEEIVQLTASRVATAAARSLLDKWLLLPILLRQP